MSFKLRLWLLLVLLPSSYFVAAEPGVVVVPLISDEPRLPAIRSANMVELVRGLVVNSTEGVIRRRPSGSPSNVGCTVPEGKRLVISKVDVRPGSYGSGEIDFRILAGGNIRANWRLPRDQFHQIPISLDILVEENSLIEINNRPTCDSFIFIAIYGYEIDREV